VQRDHRAKAPTTSVIVTTYNNPRALHLVLVALERQAVPPGEVLVADDGSGPETEAVVTAAAARSSYPVRHVWHEDEGMRKNTILNKAVVAACGKYLIFLDGDCLAPRSLIREHLRQARPNRFIGGGKVSMNENQSVAMTEERLRAGQLERIGLWWLGVEKSHRLVTGRIPFLRDWMDRSKAGGLRWPGENSSTYKEHVLAVNGFDERFTIQYEDIDFHNRLVAAGFEGHSIRYRSPVFHLFHGRPYTNPESIQKNKQLMEANLAAGMAATPHGLGASSGD
jgi:GT2 family glycosyltransferase